METKETQGEQLQWQYYGMFLDVAAKERLQNELDGLIPDDWKRYCDHMTIIYNDGSENAQQWANTCEKELGKRTLLTATHLGVSDRAMAVKVTGYPTNNALPHVTVAVAPGAKPVESNQIVNWKQLDKPIPLSAELHRVLKRVRNA